MILLLSRDGTQLDPYYWNELDGFSTMTPLLFSIHHSANVDFDTFNCSNEGIVTPERPEDYLLPVYSICPLHASVNSRMKTSTSRLVSSTPIPE